MPPTRDITDLLGPDPLAVPVPVDPRAAAKPLAAKPLFDPDAPFTAGVFTDEPFVPPVEPRRSRAGFLAVVAVVIALAGGAVLGLKWNGAPADAPAMGALVVQSNPAGVPVFIDGVPYGQTPTRVQLKAGSHILELRGRGVPRSIPLTISAGAEVSQYLEFADVPVTGQLAVQSVPVGAKVIVDGIERGVSPVTVPNLAPGDHQVELQIDGLSARHTVNVQAGATASLTMPIGTGTGTAAAVAGAGPVSGWVSVKAPFTLEIYENGRASRVYGDGPGHDGRRTPPVGARERTARLSRHAGRARACRARWP